MKRFLTGTAATLALAACSTDMGSSTAAMGDRLQDTGSAVAGAATAPMVTQAPAFVTNAAASDMYEIQSSQLALQKTQNAGVRTFAQQMIDQHTQTSMKLKTIAQSANIPVPTTLDARRQSMLSNLQAASATDFDDRYIDQQTAAHQEALTLMQSYASRGDHEGLRAFAAETAPAIEQHLMHVRQLDQSTDS
jgi:putative membrane protein